MSADNWTTCPKCKAAAEKAHAERLAKAQKSYGKVPADEYLNLMAVAEKQVALETTMREDYELGVDDCGGFFVSYRCSCEKCGFRFVFKHEANALEAP